MRWGLFPYILGRNLVIFEWIEYLASVGCEQEKQQYYKTSVVSIIYCERHGNS